MASEVVENKIHKMTRLSSPQIANKLDFIMNYANAGNAADGSVFDPNSNVTTKNIATLAAELNKDINIQIKRALVTKYISKEFGEDIANKYIEQLEKHEIYCHDESSIFPYCVAISMYPFLLDGLKAFGGDSKAPKHLSSYCGGFINLIFAVAAQFAGAVATVEFLTHFDYYARKDYGDNYLETNKKEVTQELQSVVYALNQPASARNYQSPFWNISVFDKYYFKALFGTFYYPDGTEPNWNTVNKLQKYFMQWFNEERTKALLTFPVVTVSMLCDDLDIVDKDYKDFVAEELSKGNSFFIYTSKSVDSLSSCCFEGNEKITYSVFDDKEYTKTIKEFVEENLKAGEEESKLPKDKFLTYAYYTNYDTLNYTHITGVMKKKYQGYLVVLKISREILKVTPDHLFYVRNKETGECGEITANDLLRDFQDEVFYEVLISNGNFKLISNVSVTKPIDSYVYDIELENTPYFFANGILTHNCRLRNDITDQINDFSYSLGAGGIMTGSVNVITLNMNRFIQNTYKSYAKAINLYWSIDMTMNNDTQKHDFFDYLKIELTNQIRLMHKYQIGFRKMFESMKDKGLLPCYDHGYIDMSKQYSTIGINGMLEAMEYLGLEPSDNKEYKDTVAFIFKTISDLNKEIRSKTGYKFNTEMVPSL